VDTDERAFDADQARARLMADRAQLELTLKDLRAEHGEDGPIETLSGDEGAGTTEASGVLGMAADVEAEIAEVDAALLRVDDGTYGIDEVTGEPIDPARLEARPTARTNIGH
jgi:RNA polymerase-binding transcription factor DksA